MKTSNTKLHIWAIDLASGEKHSVGIVNGLKDFEQMKKQSPYKYTKDIKFYYTELPYLQFHGKNTKEKRTAKTVKRAK